VVYFLLLAKVTAFGSGSSSLKLSKVSKEEESEEDDLSKAVIVDILDVGLDSVSAKNRLRVVANVHHHLQLLIILGSVSSLFPWPPKFIVMVAHLKEKIGRGK